MRACSRRIFVWNSWSKASRPRKARTDAMHTPVIGTREDKSLCTSHCRRAPIVDCCFVARKGPSSAVWVGLCRRPSRVTNRCVASVWWWWWAPLCKKLRTTTKHGRRELRNGAVCNKRTARSCCDTEHRSSGENQRTTMPRAFSGRPGCHESRGTGAGALDLLETL